MIRLIIYLVIMFVAFILSFIYSIGFCGAYKKTTVEYALGAGVGVVGHIVIFQPLWILTKTVIRTAFKSM